MGLIYETSYMKGTEKIELKTPNMKVLGKNMEDDEIHSFIVLKDGISQFKTGNMVYPKMNMFVRFDDGQVESQAFNLELGKQAVGAIGSLKPQKGDKIIIYKGWRDNDNGGKDPAIECFNDTAGRESKGDLNSYNQGGVNAGDDSVPKTLRDKEGIQNFAKNFFQVVDKMSEERKNNNLFIGTYFATKYEKQLEPLMIAYEQNKPTLSGESRARQNDE